MGKSGIRGSCADCGRTYDVPDPARTYRCKSCGGSVAARVAVCSACGAETAPTEPFCAACGAAQGARAARGADVALDAEERRAAAHDLTRALRAVTFVQVVFALGAVLSGLAALGILMFMQELPEQRGAVLLAACMYAALCLVNVIGFRQVSVQPYLWSVVVAALATLNLGLQLLEDPHAYAWLGLLGLFVVVLWAQVVPMARVRKLISEHPDLYSAQRMLGNEGRRHGARGSLERSREQLQAASRRRTRGSALIACGLLIAFGAAAFAAWTRAGRHLLESRLQLFTAAWADADSAGIAALSVEREVEPRQALLASQVAAHGWGSSWPALGEAVEARGDDQASVGWALPQGQVHSSWARGPDGWKLSALRLPLPPIGTAVERLQSAWKARDVAALAALFPPEHRDKFSRSLARSVERRGWGESWPALADASVEPSGEAGAAVTFRIEGDALATRWRFQEDLGWCLTSLDLPD